MAGATKRGKGPAYSAEENRAILSSPPGEPTDALVDRLRSMGFPERSHNAVKQQKKLLNDKLKAGPNATPRSARLGERYADLMTEYQHLNIRRAEVVSELQALSLEMIQVGLGIENDGDVPPEVKETLRGYVESFVTSSDDNP